MIKYIFKKGIHSKGLSLKGSFKNQRIPLKYKTLKLVTLNFDNIDKL